MPRRQAQGGKRVPAALLVAVMALAAALPGSPSANATRAQAAAPTPELNPTDRTLSLIVDVRERDRPLGETAIKIAPDDSVSVNKAQFARACAPLLREAAAGRLRALPAKAGFLALDALNAAGFKTRFDAGAMRIQFTPAVEQRPRGTVRIQRGSEPAAKPEPPARFSGYVNLRAGADYVAHSDAARAGLAPPRANLEAVLRWRDIVLETEMTYDGSAAGSDSGAGDAPVLDGFSRRGTRLVHDRPGDALRFQAGDIDPPVTAFQRGSDLLGISAERSLRKLRPGENIRPTGERSFRLARPATVKIELNGVIVRQLRLDPGEYDLKDLPLRAGANEIRLIITDDLGEQRTLDFTSYFDASLLAEDVYEWGFAAGVPSDYAGGALNYDYDAPIASGYYRAGLTPQVTGAAHLQAGRDAAMAGAGLSAATRMGFFGVDGALSYHRDHGPGAALEIDWDALDTMDPFSGLRLSADLRSRAFTAPGQDDPRQDYWLSLLASYARELPFDINANLSGRYAFASGRAGVADAYSVRLGLSRALAPALGLGLSLEYSSDALDLGSGDGAEAETGGALRAALRLSWRPDSASSISARYETGDATASVRASRSVQRGTGSWAASIETVYDPAAGDLAADSGLRYAGNRGVVSLDHTASLDATETTDRGPLLTDQRASLRLGTAIAFADGHVAIGRPITGGFAILAPHESLADRRIILGERANPQGYSDALGPPLLADLTPYAPRTLRYDVEDLPIGYDLGSREVTLTPAYKAGYAVKIGSAHSVTAFGTLKDADGAPVSLVTGTATPADGSAPPVNLFTNRAGRFAAQGLGPGRWRIEMATGTPAVFILDIPAGETGLHRAGTLRPVAQPEHGS